LKDSGQHKDLDEFTDDHRFFKRDAERLVKSKKTWALCALLDHKNVDAKILAALGLLQLADRQSVPVLLVAAKRNNYTSCAGLALNPKSSTTGSGHVSDVVARLRIKNRTLLLFCLASFADFRSPCAR
jgi:hypothetical protein